MAQLYDAIGIGYEHYRLPDRRIATAIVDALGDAATVVNVGAGAGSYEPVDRSVVAVEPSFAMIRQRPASSAPVVQASATHLPFRDAVFAAALAVLTVHHWPDRVRGLTELARVAQHRLVIVTWDPATSGFWLVEDYFPSDPGDRSAALSANGGNSTGIRDYRGPSPPGTLRLHRWLPRGILAAAACVSGPWRPQRHLHIRQDQRCGIRSYAPTWRPRGRHLGTSLWPSLTPVRAGSGLPAGHCSPCLICHSRSDIGREIIRLNGRHTTCFRARIAPNLTIRAGGGGSPPPCVG